MGDVEIANPLDFVVTKLGTDGQAVWQARVPVGLDWIGDIINLEIGVADEELFVNMAAYQDFSTYDKLWIHAAKLREADGAILVQRDLARDGWFRAPQILLHPFGGSLFLERSGGFQFSRMTPNLDVVWGRFIGTDYYFADVETDPFGQTWLVGSRVQHPDNWWTVQLWSPRGADQSRHDLRYPGENAYAADVAFDSTGRAYVLGRRGNWVSSTSILAQFPAQRAPVPRVNAP